MQHSHDLTIFMAQAGGDYTAIKLIINLIAMIYLSKN